MNLKKTLTISAVALVLGSGTAVANPATAAPSTGVSAQAGWHPIWDSWVPKQSTGKWKSNAYRSPSRATRAVLRCYNTRASMKVRIFEYLGGGRLRKVADSGWKRCNPNGHIIAKGTVNNTRHWLKVRLDGLQGSFVRAEKWS
ncbi:hypothetical protein [Streptomyces sp. H51]|uniref:hypothetical protein n=1 Tax=Streptomyces sp. H51 TaxID=3111770 RepID=UPI002D78714F|nr:hypothetical protein [Streptomyces sp. H51]